MNKSGKIVLIVAAICIVIGGALAAIGFAFGGTRAFVVNYGNHEVPTDREIVSGSIDIDAFDELIVDTMSIDVIVEEGTEYRIEYSVFEEYVPIVEQSGKKLSIQQPKVNSNAGMISFSFNNYTPFYKIIVPKMDDAVECEIKLTSGGFTNNVFDMSGDLTLTSGKVILSDIEFEGKMKVTSGSISLENISGNELLVEKTSGGMNMKNCKYDEIKIDTSSGNSMLENCEANDFSLDSTSGELSIKDGKYGDMRVEMSSGDITLEGCTVNNYVYDLTSGSQELNIKGNESDYDFSLSSTSGEISVGGKDVGNKYSDVSGKDKKISGESSSGDLRIIFE